MKSSFHKGVWGDIPQLPRRFKRERGDFPLPKKEDVQHIFPLLATPLTSCHCPLEERHFIAKNESWRIHFDTGKMIRCRYSCDQVEVKLVQAQPSLSLSEQDLLHVQVLPVHVISCFAAVHSELYIPWISECLRDWDEILCLLMSLFFAVLSLSLMLSLFWVEGKTGGRRGTDALVKGRRGKCSPPLQEMMVKLKQTKRISMPNSSAAFISAEWLEQLERHGCDSRENLVQLPNRYVFLAWATYP